MNEWIFKNKTNNKMTFEDVINNIREFVKKDPTAKYVLSIGTDSQVGSKTCFVTAVIIHRVGKGAWACWRKQIMNRPIKSLREKITMETMLTQEILGMFTPEVVNSIIDEMVEYINKGSDFKIEAHLDIGTTGETRVLIKEMVGWVKGMGVKPVIKPDSYAASSYADKHSKIY